MYMARRARWLVLLIALSAGTLFQVGTYGCAEFYTTAALSAFDFCSVFNCTGGAFFNFCDPVPLLADCPNVGQAVTP